MGVQSRPIEGAMICCLSPQMSLKSHTLESNVAIYKTGTFVTQRKTNSAEKSLTEKSPQLHAHKTHESDL